MLKNHLTRPWLLSSGLLLLSLIPSLGEAAESGRSLATILDASRQRSVSEVDAYTRENPEAADLEEAYRWLFTTARTYRLEPLVAEAAARYLASEHAVADTTRMARQIQLLAMAHDDQLEQAVGSLKDALKGVSLREPDSAIEFAFDLAAEAQLQHEPLAARAILDQTANSFFLNQYVRRTCENRLRKIELLDQAAPPVELADINGTDVKLENWQGKVVLVDFWATNCAPCLAEMPMLKRLRRDHAEAGFDIIGISLDDDPETVRRFLEKQKIDWTIAIHGPAEGGIRNRYAVDTIPSTFLIDRQGRVIAADLRGINLERAIVAELNR